MHIIRPKLDFIGIIRATTLNADGSVSSVHDYYNTDTYFMQSAVASWLAGTKTTSSTPPPTQIGAGNGYGTPSESDTSLWSPLSGTLRNCDSITVSQSIYAQFNITYGNGSDPLGAYTEVGLFDASGNLWAHAAINEYISTGQTLTIQWMIQMVASTSNANAVVTNTLLTTVVGWLTGTMTTTSNPPPTNIQLGTGSGTVSVSDTALWTPTTSTSKHCDYIVTTSPQYGVNYSLTYLSSDPTGNFTETGLFDVNGNMWVHGTLTGANKTGSYLLSVLIQIPLSGD